ncbi:MAG TPA: aldo/keto reductase [Kribbellaceae bacterium]
MKLFGAHRVGLGAAPIGNLFRPVSDEDARATVDAAWDAGWRYFDTAPHYGLGLSERRLGAALRGRPRSEYVLSTKAGRLLVDTGVAAADDANGFAVTSTLRRRWDFSADGIRRSLSDSLERLGTDRVDVVYLHDPDDHYEEALRTGFPALAALRDEGVVGAIGAGMNQSAMLTSFVRETDLDVVMLAGRYTVLDHGALDDLLPACVERGVDVVAVGVFNSGLLSSDRPLPGATFDYAPADAARLATANRIADICESHGVPLPAVALQFPLAHPAVAGIAVGCHEPTQVHRNAALETFPIPPAVWTDLRTAGLLHPDAPTG